MIRILSIFVVFVMLSQCVKAQTSVGVHTPAPPSSLFELTPKQLLTLQIQTNKANIEVGRQVYTSTCIRCHNSNPRLPGTIGPDLYTTPREVFHTKVPDGKYPTGYKPKRKSRVMPRFKHLTNKVDQVYDYIQSK